MRLEVELANIAREVFTQVTGTDSPPIPKPTQNKAHGDYQLNGVMGLGKKLGQNPRELAAKIADQLKERSEFTEVSVAGPGFINLRLAPSFIAKLFESLRQSDHGVPPVQKPERIVVDFSGPNIAKQMHVGHLRSTILGQAVVNLLRFVGHTTLGDNHVGDWGTQYGLLIAGLRQSMSDGEQRDPKDLTLVELEQIYKTASARSESDPEFRQQALKELAKLQQGDPENRALWQQFVDITKVEVQKIYDRLGVSFDLWMGESAYEPFLPKMIERLDQAGLTRVDQEALCIFFSDWDDAPPKLKAQKEPFIVRKKDGAFLYSTTDLATVAYRVDELKADRAIYVVDSRQALHFEQVFAVAKKLGMNIRLEHVGFGTVLGADSKPLKTRDASGKVLTLASLLDEAEVRANALLETELKGDETEQAISLEARKVLAAQVGIGAVKYADLRQNRMSDYQFDFDKMIEFKGNAGPYMQYAVARVKSIFKKAGVDPKANIGSFAPQEPSEWALVKGLLQFPDAVHDAAETCQPHLLSDHLYEIAKLFSAFYEACPILRAEADVRNARLALTQVVADQLETGLKLLGIATPESM